VVVLDPGTHLPLTRISPNLLEQLLQATPPSLYVKAYVLAGHSEKQNPLFKMLAAPQLRHCLLVNCPKATYTKEKLSIGIDELIVMMKFESILEPKVIAFPLIIDSRVIP